MYFDIIENNEPAAFYFLKVFQIETMNKPLYVQ